ncbi:MAG: hypothetical protein R1F54_08955 [Candidatus Zeuxoniibacter abyssi]|nr:MAG: hypothetical protein R1F54_08955 [Candidatus Persebacteraceae bacterium AB1(2)]
MSENTTNPDFCRIDHLALIAIEGDDAAHFLQGQISADTVALADGRWLRAVYCNPKGRILASLIICRDDKRFFAVLARDIADGIVARLKMFVMRAKVTITRLNALFAATAEKSPPPTGGGEISRDGESFVLSGESFRFWPDLNSSVSVIADNGDWLQNEILRGVPWIAQATQEMFIPQFVNFDLLHGINFKKGCYVGQEIIARLHYLGGVKKRGMILCGDGEAPQPGENLSAAGASPFAEIVNSSTVGGSFVSFAAVSKTAMGQELTWRDQPLKIKPPPYGLPDEDAKKRPKI